MADIGKTIEIIGAGPSGLFLADACHALGLKVRVIEANHSVGGMVQTLESPYGRIETGANAFRATAELEEVAARIGIELLPAESSSRRRFVFFRGRPRSVGPWSLGPLRAVLLAFRYFFMREGLKPRGGESVWQYGSRILGTRLTHKLLLPALSGVYAGDPDRLSASLIFGKYFSPAVPGAAPRSKPRARGSVAPKRGMGDFFSRLYDWCADAGIEFRFGERVVAPKEASGGAVRVYTGSPMSIVQALPPSSEGAAALRSLDVLPLVSVSLFFDEPPADLSSGFGMLFPRKEGVRSLGVLFNQWIFSSRSDVHSETWILGGALDREAHLLDDAELLAVILADRARALGQDLSPRFSRVQRWPGALPHFDLNLEEKLRSGAFDSVRAFGTFRGSLGIGDLPAEARRFAKQLAEDLRFEPPAHLLAVATAVPPETIEAKTGKGIDESATSRPKGKGPR